MESDNERLDRNLEKVPRGDIPGVTEEDLQLAKKTYPQIEWTDEKIEMAKALGHL